MAGNAAVTQQIVVARAPQKVDKAKLTAIDQRLSAVAGRANGRCDQILSAADESVKKLKDAKEHLKSSTANYKAAYTAFTDALKKADKTWEADKAISDSVQGLLVAAALAVIGPEVLAVEAAKVGVVRMMASTNSVVARVGEAGVYALSEAVIKAGSKSGAVVAKAAEGAAGEAAEQAAGAGVDSARDLGGVGVGPKPTDTAAGAGPTAGDKFEEAFGRLDGLIDLLPQFGAPAKSQKDLAMAANGVAREALKLAGGGTAKLQQAEVEKLANDVEGEDATAAAEAGNVAKLQERLAAAAGRIMSTKIDSPTEIERKLWLRWMASVDPQVLDNDYIEEYLGPKGKGMVDFGAVNWFWERRAAVDKAMREWSIEATGAAPTAPVPGSTPPPTPNPPPR